MEITKNKITEIFCIIDDFCQEYDKEIARMSICEPDGRKHRNRKWTMSRSEIWHSKKNDSRLSRTQVRRLRHICYIIPTVVEQRSIAVGIMRYAHRKICPYRK